MCINAPPGQVTTCWSYNFALHYFFWTTSCTSITSSLLLLPSWLGIRNQHLPTWYREQNEGAKGQEEDESRHQEAVAPPQGGHGEAGQLHHGTGSRAQPTPAAHRHRTNTLLKTAVHLFSTVNANFTDNCTFTTSIWHATRSARHWRPFSRPGAGQLRTATFT